MSDVSKTSELIAEARFYESPGHVAAYAEGTLELLRDLADALEAATREQGSAGDIRRAVRLWSERFIPGDRWDTEDARDLDAALKCVVEANPNRSRARVPVQGEPNNDRVAFFERARMGANHLDNIGQTVLCRWTDGGKFTTADIRELERLASRATVPDAATEELARIKPLFENYSREYPNECNKRVKAEAERDAATAAVERIREAVSGHPECDRYSEDDVISCGWKSAYASVIAALDGAPEPEWEYRVTLKNGPELARGTLDEVRRFKTIDIERRRKAGPWEPVGGEN